MLNLKFLFHSGANFVVRKMASHSNPSVDITQDGEKFHIKLHSLFVTRESNFTVGDEYEETQHNGAVMKVRIRARVQTEATFFGKLDK